MNIALQLYSVRNSLKKDFWGTMRLVRAMGYTGVEGFGNPQCTAQEFKAALDDTGLAMVGWHQGFPGLDAKILPTTMTYHKVLGLGQITVPSYGADGFASKEACAATAAALEDAAVRLRPYGVTLGYHNHAYEYNTPIDGVAPMERVMRDAPSVRFQLDTGNAVSGGGDIYGCFDRFPGRFETVHFKPYSAKTKFDTMIGSDDTDWVKLVALCREKGNTKWAVIEYEKDADSHDLANVETALNALAKYI
jgi:sugar phosphate isomerase/epimerase